MTPASPPLDRGVTLVLASVGQRQLWLHDRVYAHDGSYNISLGIALSGPLNVAALGAALNAVVARHEPLRTSFALEGDDLHQVIADHLSMDLPAIPIDGPVPDGWAVVRQRLASDGATPFDLDVGPLFRATLYQLSSSEHALTLVLHHTVFDGWSVGVLIEELGACYDRAAAGGAVELPPLEVQFADFAEWQRDQLVGADGQSSLDYWRQQLADASPWMALPTDRPRRAVMARRGRLRERSASPALRSALGGLCRVEGTTLFMVLITGFAALLHRYSQQRDLLIATPVAGRTRHELEPLIGYFINTVLVRSRLEGDPTFRDLLAAVKATTLAAQTHQSVPLDSIHALMRGGRDEGRLPLLQVMMALQSATPEPKAFGGLRVALFWGHNGTAKCDLFLNASDEPGGLRFELEYDIDLFDEATADRLLDSYQCLLEAAVAAPEARLDRLPILSASDRALLGTANATSTAYPREQSIAQLFVDQARATPDRVAVTCGREHLTYGQLNRRANQLARGLMARGVRPEVLVGVALDRSLDLVVTILGVLKAGGAYLPLDLTYPVDRVAFMLSDTQVPIVVTTRRDAPQLPPEAPVLCLDDPADALFAAEDGDVALHAEAGHLAYVMYTSGSTGRPKGVAIPNRGVVRLVRGTTFVDWDDVESMLHLAPIAFDASTFEVWGALLNGKRLVIQPDRHPGLDPLAQTLRAERVDCLWLTAALFNTVMDDRPELLMGVRQLLIGGEALSVPHVRRALDRLPSTRIVNGYGPTECTTFACCYPIPKTLPADVTSVPIGAPIANTRAYVLDAYLDEVPIGVAGELYLGGDGLARGYLNQPSLTAERFVADPFSGAPGDRLYRTGDRVRRLGDGTLEFMGRFDRQIKLRGFRIELGEIEAVIGRHPDVHQAVVVLREDGSGPPRLVAYVKARPGAAAALESVRAALVTALPEYMVPSTFVAVSAFPLTPNGKVDYAALPAPITAAAASESEAPATATEVALAAIWQTLLGEERSVGRHDNFFDRGGNSLVAIRLFSRVSASMGVELPFGLLLQQPTLSALASAIDRQRTPDGGAAPASALTPLRTTGHRPPLFFTHGVGGEVWSFKALTHHLGDDQPVYGLQPVRGGLETAVTVPEIAARYIQEIRTVSPHGPYLLAGHCAGAAVAYEMARQLHDAGEPVALVAALDYWFFDTADRRLRARAAEFLLNLPTWIRDDLRHVTLATILGRIRSKLRIAAAAAKWAVSGAEAPPVDIRDRLGMWRFPDYQVAEIERAFKTFQDYRPLPYDGDLLLIRARALPLFPARQAPDMGWSRIVRGTVTVKEVRGSHETILTEPLVSDVAEVLRDAVDRVIAERDRASNNNAPKR